MSKEIAENSFDTIVVGAGIAGLTAATYLSREGRKVLLFEKNKECGGLVNSFVLDGFLFDAGVRALEDAGIIFPMLEDLGIHLDVVKSPVSVGVEKEILNIENFDSLKKYRDLLIKLYPESEKEVYAVIKVIKKVMKNMEVLYGVENPAFKDLKKDRKYIFKQLLPWLPKFILTVGKINRMNMPVEEYLEKIIKNSSLKDIISQHFFKNTPTFFALSYFSLYLDYFYPKGGVGKLSQALESKIVEWGGQIKTETKITEVMADERLVKDENNVLYQYENLIWAADLKMLYKNTKTDGLLPKIRTEIEEVKEKMLAKRGGDSVFTLFLEVDEPLETFKKIAHGHFFYTPSKLGLGDTHLGELKKLLSNWDDIEKEQFFTWLDKFTKLNTFEISIPGLKDPDLVPPGKTGLIVSFLVEYDLFKNTQKDGWYEEFKLALEDRLLQILSDSIFPMLKDKIIKRFSYTPLSIENRVGSSEGAITGWSFQEPVPVLNKMQHSGRSVLTPMPSVYQAGQWAYSPAGVPMSILTGKIAVDHILKKTKAKLIPDNTSA